MWHFEKSGNFSVRSGFRVAQNIRNGVHTSDRSFNGWWKSLWKLGLPSKIKLFWWWVLHESLPVHVNIQRCLSHVDPSCGICKKHSETESHALWSCSEAAEIWMSSQFA